MIIGEKIKRLRVLNGLTQEELANRCELTKVYFPGGKGFDFAVDCYARGYSGEPGDQPEGLFNDRIQEKVVFTADDIFTNEDEDLMHRVDWIVPNAQKNMMEPIMVTLEPGGNTSPQDPHEGEEFGYVLKGHIYLHLGKQKFKASRGDCFYFIPNVAHYLANGGKSEAKVLWVSTPPSF